MLDEIVVMDDASDLLSRAGTVDFLISTIPAAFDMKPYVSLLKHDGTLVTVGTLEPTPPEGLDLTMLTLLRAHVAGSLIGSVAETQEVLDFCAGHGIASEVEVIPIDKVNEAFDRVVAKDARLRFVIDTSTLRCAYLQMPCSSLSEKKRSIRLARMLGISSRDVSPGHFPNHLRSDSQVSRLKGLRRCLSECGSVWGGAMR